MNATPSDLFEQIGRFLLGMADLFEQLIPKLREFGRELVAHAKTGKYRAKE